MKRDFGQLNHGIYDLLVIGGGIVGAWTAYDAALRGLTVALVDKGDWGCGTSSASSKLIHGGLRYLEQLDLGLVRKALSERRRLARLGPHRVRPLRFLIPIYRHGRVGPLKFRLGLVLYDLLAGRRQPVARHRKLARQTVRQVYGFLNDNDLRCAFTFGDCQTDDARLTLEIVDGAIQAGAHAVNYAEAIELIMQSGEAAGAVLRDSVSGETTQLSARVTVNATSVWSRLLPGFQAEPRAGYRMTKGVHLVLPRLPTEEAMLLTAESDGRVFFVIPWYGRTLLGTTDTDYTGDPDKASVDPADIEYLLREANRALNDVRWTASDVLGSFCGLRMLRADAAVEPSAASRDWSLYEHGKSLLVPIGGKLTTARLDAAKIVDVVCSRLEKPKLACQTASRTFPWAPTEEFDAWSSGKLGEATSLGIDQPTAMNCIARYGTRLDLLFEQIRANPDRADRVVEDLAFCWAELHHAAEHEMVVQADDILRRRVPLSILAQLPEEVLRVVRNILGTNHG